MFTPYMRTGLRLGTRLRRIIIVTAIFDAFYAFTLADLLSVPTLSPILDPDVPHGAQSIW